MMRSMVILGAALLAGCGAHNKTTGAPAPAAALEPCAVPVPSADSLEWKLVRAKGFVFCVPPGWHPAGSRGWRNGGSGIEWAVGAPPQATEFAIRLPAMSTEPLPQPRHFVETIGGESAELSDSHLKDADYTSARWSDKRLYFQGKARGPRGAEIELMIFRTVRFDGSEPGA